MHILTLSQGESLTITFRIRPDADIHIKGPANIHTENGVTTITRSKETWRYFDKDVLYIYKQSGE